MNAPKEITAGFTYEWEETFSQYPASTYGLTATFILNTYGNTRYTVTAVANGDGFSFTIPATVSADFTAGNYKLYLFVTLGAAKYLVGNQDVVIKANPLTATGDTRSHIQKVLDAIEAVLENRATQEYQSMSINGYSITQMSPEELLKLRSYYKNELRKANNLDRINNGGSPSNTIKVKFL